MNTSGWTDGGCHAVVAMVTVVTALMGGGVARAAPQGLPAPAAGAASAAAAPVPLSPRPRIGLVLSGGGARGLAHVGVLKVLEAAHVPIDAIAGTSMGAIIGGLYASGIGAEQLERELLAVDWTQVFASRPARESLSLRRKEADYEIAPAVEVGLNPVDGQPMLPLGSVSSRGLELLLRRYTLPVRQVRDFDALPIPFRAVATDMESGDGVVFRDGDLAQALRASMSVPGVFPPSEVRGRILGDGGLVNNLPIDVVRAMGVDIVIAVNVGTPLSRRDALGTVVGLTSQMINILTEQNVQRSLTLLAPGRDVLIAPDLGSLSSSDFTRARELVTLGSLHMSAEGARLAELALPGPAWGAYLAQRADARRPLPEQIASVRFEGTVVTHPERRQATLESQPGGRFDVAAAERDSRQLAASGDYLHADYRVEDTPLGAGLVFDLAEKPWGPNYFRAGLEFNSDFAGQGQYNVKVHHERHWLNEWGAEWRNRLQLGTTPRFATEWYQPLGSDGGRGNDWFLAGSAALERHMVTAYSALAARQSATEATVTGRYGRNVLTLRADVGQPWGSFGEVRFGLQQETLAIDPEFAADSGNADALTTLRMREQALRLSLVADQLDDVSFARSGYRLALVGLVGQRQVTAGASDSGATRFTRVELDATTVQSWGRHTLDSTLRLRTANSPGAAGPGYYRLGGFQNLSGYHLEQLAGDRLLLGRLTYYARLNTQPVLTRGFFAGASLEAGNAWLKDASMQLSQLRVGGSVFLGADTGLGPLYLGLTWAPKGVGPGLYLLLGRP